MAEGQGSSAEFVAENEFSVPEHVNVAYVDVINEPDSIKDHKVVKIVTQCTSMTYTFLQIGIYLVLQVVFGTLLSVFWGLIYGIAVFMTVWMAQPFIRLFVMAMRCMLIPYKSVVRSCCDPCYISMSFIFSQINFLHRRMDVKPLEQVVVEQPTLAPSVAVENQAYNLYPAVPPIEKKEIPE